MLPDVPIGGTVVAFRQLIGAGRPHSASCGKTVTAGNVGATMVPTDLAGAIWAEAQAPSAEDFDAVVDGLITEFNQLPARVVIEHVVLACQQLLAAGRQDDLGRATEAMARMRLREMSPDTSDESRSVEGPSAGHQ